MPERLPRFCAGLAAGACLAFSPPLHGAGFAIAEQSVSGLGHAFAGSAAVADDASTIYHNPAGLIRLEERSTTFGLHAIFPQADYTDEGSTGVVGEVLGGGLTDKGGTGGLVPNLYFTQPLSETVVVGIGINAPFGLVTEYAPDWVGRYHAVKSELATINVNPSLAVRLSDKLTLGFGVSIQYAEAELSQAVDFGAIAGLTPQSADGFTALEGDDWSLGFNLGLLYEFSEHTRLGLHYRSHVRHTLEGEVDFTLPAALQGTPLAGNFPDQAASAPLTLPETFSASLYHELTDTVALLADVTWTRWSRFETLTVEFSQGLPAPSDVSQEQWKDVPRFSVGTIWEVHPRWTLRAGLAYDKSPVPNAALRSPRIPDEDRFWVALGVGYALNESLTLDIAYAHIFVEDPLLRGRPNEVVPGASHRLTGRYEASVDILSAGGSLRF